MPWVEGPSYLIFPSGLKDWLPDDFCPRIAGLLGLGSSVWVQPGGLGGEKEGETGGSLDPTVLVRELLEMVGGRGSCCRHR